MNKFNPEMVQGLQDHITKNNSDSTTGQWVES
jgi:hypothetical protein